jgi:hypothetical protein
MYVIDRVFDSTVQQTKRQSDNKIASVEDQR